MYKLTLTAADRRAIDWVGNRYTNGEELYQLLMTDGSIDSDDWISDKAITFCLEENVVWQMRDNAASEDGSWPCFSPALAKKMQGFIDKIV